MVVWTHSLEFFLCSCYQSISFSFELLSWKPLKQTEVEQTSAWLWPTVSLFSSLQGDPSYSQTFGLCIVISSGNVKKGSVHVLATFMVSLLCGDSVIINVFKNPLQWQIYRWQIVLNRHWQRKQFHISNEISATTLVPERNVKHRQI